MWTQCRQKNMDIILLFLVKLFLSFHKICSAFSKWHLMSIEFANILNTAFVYNLIWQFPKNVFANILNTAFVLAHWRFAIIFTQM